MGSKRNFGTQKDYEDFFSGLLVHFPDAIEKNVSPAELTCEMCEDKKIKVCDGEGRKGETVLDCMMLKVGKIKIEKR
jgi:hypothetical protein